MTQVQDITNLPAKTFVHDKTKILSFWNFQHHKFDRCVLVHSVCDVYGPICPKIGLYGERTRVPEVQSFGTI